MTMPLESLLRKYGKNSNAFLALYPGYSYFYLDDPAQGCIAYIKTKSAWVALTEPFAAEERQLPLLEAFAAEAKAAGKAAIALPVEREFAETAKRKGFASFQIGSEPYFDLAAYPPPGRDWLDVSHSAKSLKFSKGFSVRQVTLEEASRALRLELGQILQDWIDSRKTSELGFVNRVEPFVLSPHKRYFIVEGHGRAWAFLACIPIWGVGGWYFIDVIRRKDSPAGSIELLMLEAMRALRESGAQWISLGVSPLAKLEPHKESGESFVSRLTPYFFNHFQLFYNFESLYNFKSKFQPSQWRPSYVIHNLGRADLRLLSVLTDVFVPQGPFAALAEALRRKFDFRSYAREMNLWISEKIILRSPIEKLSEIPRRAPLSMLLIAVWILFFLAVHPVGEGMSFSFVSMTRVNSLASAWRVWGLPGFLHWNILHLTLNLVTFLLVGITLEIFCGSAILLLAYVIGHLLANTLTGCVVWCFSKAVPLALFSTMLRTRDVGASLGIWACAGAWSYLLKNKTAVWIVFPAAVLGVAILKSDFFQVNHIFAAALGLVVSGLYFGKLKSEGAGHGVQEAQET